MRSRHGTGGGLRKATVLLAAGATLIAGLAACSSSASSPGSSTPRSGNPAADMAAALAKPSTITVWAWATQTKDIADAFHKQYPNVTVNLVNAGTNTTEYTKLQNAVKAGSGVPDVAQIEYYALPQFALSGSLADLKQYGLDSVQGDYSQAVWNAVTVNGKLQALPWDTGPMALFYNKTVFDKYGLTVPKTWAEYVDDAKKLHAADPTKYLTNDAGDPGFTTSMIWDAGGQPFKVSGTSNVNINLQDPGSRKFADTWNQMISGGLLSPIASWSDQWYQGLANGSIASLVTGAWMPGALESGVPTGTGQWRVAPMPTWEAGAPAATAQNGGSSAAVMKSSSNPLVAAAFVKFMNNGPGAQIFAAEGGFPSVNSILQSQTFLDAAPAYFGGQKINQVLSAAAQSVIPGWSYLPFEVYANSVFNDSVGKAYADKSDLNAGLKAWQDTSAQYGKQQGFTVTTG